MQVVFDVTCEWVEQTGVVLITIDEVRYPSAEAITT